MTATEPFDEILDRRLKALDSEKVGWDATVADRRKKVPRNIHGLEADLENRRSAAEWMEEGDDEDGVASAFKDLFRFAWTDPIPQGEGTSQEPRISLLRLVIRRLSRHSTLLYPI